jgi:two-component sensor histidine kinase
VEELETDLKSRMGALARAHDLTLPDLSGSADPASATTTVSALLKAIVAPHEHSLGPSVDILGTDAPLKGGALTSLALLLHELTTNAAKYGALSNTSGSLVISVSIDDETLTLSWEEHVEHRVDITPQRQGFGTKLEKAALSGLAGSINRVWRPDGLSLTVEMPVEKLLA